MNYKIIDNKTTENGANSKKIGTATFLPLTPEWSLDEIIMSKELRDTLEDIIAFCQNKQRIMKDWELNRFMKSGGGCIAINFWGLPGTGKSIAAEALATAMNKKIIQASYANLMDSLQGNTEKNISALFETAVAEDCVILFDEADGLLSARKQNSANADTSNLIKSHLLNLLDRSSAIVIFTTNFFKSYDRAFVRRILWNVEFKTPGLEELEALWKFHLSEKVPCKTTHRELAGITFDESKERGLNITGGDIRKLTLALCTRLSSGRIKMIDNLNAKEMIRRYLADLQEGGNTGTSKDVEIKPDNLPKDNRDSLEVDVKPDDLPKNLRDILNK